MVKLDYACHELEAKKHLKEVVELLNRKKFGGQLFQNYSSWANYTSTILNENDLKINLQALSNYFPQTRGVILHTEIENLDVISAGSIPPNPSELILSEAFLHILNTLKERYDIVVIDSPPVGIVTDGVKVLSDSDIPIYVFKSNYSKRIFAKKINELYQLKQIKNINVILNNVSISKNEFGYGYGYYEEEN